MYNKAVNLVVLAVLAVCLTISLSLVYLSVANDYAMYKASGTCIAKHIAQGVERKHITVRGATCHINNTLGE